MTNLSRLTLAAALLGGMALPALAQPGAAAVGAKLHHGGASRVAATETVVKQTPKDGVASKDATKPAAPAAPVTTMTAKPTVPGQTVQAPTVAPKVD